MATTFQQYEGDGSTRNFSIPFPYLDRAHVLVLVNGTQQPVPEFLTDSMVRLPTAPASGALVEIRRRTPTGIIPVDFQDGSILAERELDTIASYSAYLAEEAADAVAQSLRLTSSGVYDAGGRRISGLTPGELPQDAATVGQLGVAVLLAESSAAKAQTAQSQLEAALAAAPADGTVFGLAAGLSGPTGGSLIGTTDGRSAQQQFDDLSANSMSLLLHVPQQHKAAILDGTSTYDATGPVLEAIAALRRDSVTILNTIGGINITAYSSGTLVLPRGLVRVSPDALQLSQDLGLTIRGQGSRRTNNSVRASTTLLISGSSTGFGVQALRNGGRGLTLEDLDLCYESPDFAGDVLDVYSAPGVTLNRVFLGTYGLTAGTRLRTARSLVRGTYDEFFKADTCVFDGAVDGWWSDDARSFNGNSFGGSLTQFSHCTFYDFTAHHMRHDGLRTRQGLQIDSVAFNPIGASCDRAVNLSNVEGLQINGGGFAGSTTHKANIEWVRLSSATGHIQGAFFNDLSKAGTVDGMLDLSGNRVFCTDGFTLTGGVITGGANEFSAGTTGFTLAPTYALCADLGPNLFKSAVTNSYSIPADSAFLSGRIAYDASSDQSTGKFSNASGRVSIENIDERIVTTAATAYTIAITDTGRTIAATGASAQVFTLPLAAPGTTIKITKISGQDLTINRSGANVLYTGTGGAKTSASALAANVGGSITLEAYGTVGWVVKSLVGTWAFA